MDYFVYMVECSDTTLYIGISKDVEKRVCEHNESKLAAKYTRGRRPVRLLYSERASGKGAALRREIELKKLSREQKLRLIV